MFAMLVANKSLKQAIAELFPFCHHVHPKIKKKKSLGFD